MARRWPAVYTTPDCTAHTAACVLSFTASFRSKFWTCSFTVSTLISSDRVMLFL